MVSRLVAALTVMVVLVIVGALIAGIWYAARRLDGNGRRIGVLYSLGVALWAGLAFVLGALGTFATNPDTVVPVIGPAIAGPIVAGLLAWPRSKTLRNLVGQIPLPALIGVQSYRVVGALFLIAFAAGVLPGEFALHAGIGDVLIGVTAPLVAFALLRGAHGARTAATLWGVAGLTDLAAAVVAGSLSSPSALQVLALDSPNFAITRFPLVLIPTIVVPVSALLHYFALKHPDAQVERSRQTRVEGLASY